MSLYSRYNRYTQANGNNRNFTSAGLTVSIPLPLRINASKSVVDAEYLEFKNQRENINQNTINEISNLCYEFEYAFNDYIKFYIKKLKLKEEIRIEKAKRDIKDVGYSSMHLLKLYNVLYDINHELEDINKRLYLYLIDINKYFPNNTITDFSTRVDFDELFKKPTETKSMYLWSKDFKKNTNTKIIQTLVTGGFNELIISTNNDVTTEAKLNQLSTELKKKNIHCLLLIGKNNWLGDLNQQTSFLNAIPKNIFDGIHLDIEPHAVDGWKTGKKDSLIQDYLNMLQNIEAQSSLPISVSIPTYYEESFLTLIRDFTSTIYIMAYENIDIDFIERKIKEERSIFPSNDINIAVSMKDFQSKKAFEEHISSIKNSLKINNIAIHDYDTYIMLNNQ